MTVEIIIKLAYAIGGAILAAAALVTKLVKVCKERKHAKTEAEKEAAKNEMLDVMQSLIQTAEDAYKDVNQILKQNGSSAGAVKKDTVMTRLQAYAIAHNYAFDEDYWSSKIDQVVDLTKLVNAK